MAGASMNDIKSRIKSVQSTMQITKAMELVATSKLRRAKEKVERSRPYYLVLDEAIKNIIGSSEIKSSLWSRENEGKPTLYVVIAGDRGLAGGYNANVFRLTELLSKKEDGKAVFLPIGKKAIEYYSHREREIISKEFSAVSDVGVGYAFSIAEIICEAYKSEKISKAVLVYTKFVSMMSQLPVYEELLPFSDEEESKQYTPDPLIEEDAEEMIEKIMPNYVGGIVYSAVTEALASESGARRSSMNAANKNASEMIDTLMLKYNRARQAVITQEITEIVSGAEAL